MFVRSSFPNFVIDEMRPQRATLHLSYLLFRLRTSVISRYWWAARAGSKLTRSHKRARECLPKPCAEKCASYVLAVLIALIGCLTDPVFIMKEKWCSSAVFPRAAHPHRCQVSPHCNHSVPITFSRYFFRRRPLPILSGDHLQNSLTTPCTCIRACRAVTHNRWDVGGLIRGFHGRTVRGCDCTSRTARRAVYHRARGGWTSH